MTHSGEIRLGHDGPVARVTISNLARLNAMSRSMWLALGDVIVTVDKDPGMRAVVVRGEGEKSFISGADISEFESQRADVESVASYDVALTHALAAITECAKPVVACIHGVCVGGGISLAAACDLRYAAKDARFRMPAARLGLGYSRANTNRLVKVVGAARAADLFYTARFFDGAEAERIGLVHRAYEAGELDDAVEQCVSMIVENAPLTIRAAKLAIQSAVADPGELDIERVERAVRACSESRDYAEGRTAFMEKRKPRFTGS